MRLRIFINRPILSSVISIIIVLCGLVAMFNMPVAQYPNISPPTISVQAQYPGASAETIERTVAAQLEAQLNGVPKVIYMNSNSTGSGSVSVKLTFEIGTNLNIAINDVLNRVHAAMPLLPEVVQALGVNVRKSSPDILLNIAFYNDGGTFDIYYMSNYLYRTVYNDLNLVNGVGQIIYHAKYYAMRVWLNVNAMNSLNVTSSDIATAIKDQSNEYLVGVSNGEPTKNAYLTFNVAGSSMYTTAQQYEDIVIRQSGTQIIKLKDIAKVELGAYSYNVFPQLTYSENGAIRNTQIAVMQVYMDPSGNQLEVKKRVLSKLEKDSHNFPTGLKYRVVFDATQFVTASIKNVKEALIDAFILVGIIILIFLQNIRASFIALITIPVSVIGGFALLYLFGFTINTLTLFAMILAIGIVVDDAIVVIENIERLKHSNTYNLSIRYLVEIAMHEVFGAIIAIALVLSVVFLPVMFLGGLPGVLYRQFAVTIACTVVLSAITTLTLTPALSGLLLKKITNVTKFTTIFNKYFSKLTNFYLDIAEKLINLGKYTWLTLLVALLGVGLIFKFIPLSFMPNEDMGYVIASITLPATSSLKDTQDASRNIANDIMKLKAVDKVTQIVGVDFFGGGANTYAATIIVLLKNWQYRKDKKSEVSYVVQYMNSLNSKYKSVLIRAFNQPPVKGLSTTGGVEFYLEGRTVNNLKELDNKATELEKAIMKHKEIKSAYHLLDTNVEQVLTEADVAKTKFYGVNVQNVYNALHYIYSNYNVNFAYIMQGLVWVILQGDYPYRRDLKNMSNMYVRNNQGNLVSINSLVKTKFYKEPLMVERFNDYPATQVIVTPNDKISSGVVMNIIKQEMSNIARGYDYEWYGTSYMQTQSQKTSKIAFAFAVTMIYLVLCALYEMWRLPLVVIMGVPFALIGSGVMLLVRQQPNDLYFQISLITLLGLSAKNIILLIEFALQGFNGGMTARDAVLHALKLRFRPIVMTSITFIMGALPLVFATGAGANAEHSVGTGIIGGILGSVILGTLVTPSYFVLIMRNYKNKKD